MAALAALATLLVGMGLRSLVIPAAMMLAAALSVWLTDVSGRLVLGAGWANLARVGALVYCVATLRWERHALVMDVARLLVFLQVVVLFQKKDTRTYWHLAELGLLQVVVAGLLTQGMMFGLLLVVYLVVGLSALALLFLWQERNRCQPAAVPQRPAAAGSRWPLAGQVSAFSGGAPGRLAVEGELFTRLLRLAAASLVLSILAFFAVPRLGHGAWRANGQSIRATVGFNDRVRLGELGRVIQNPQEVLRIAFHDEATGGVYPVESEVYLRGALLTWYDEGEWTCPPRNQALTRSAEKPASALPARSRELVRQRIQLEALDRPELFCVWPFRVPEEQRRRVVFEHTTQRLMRSEGIAGTRFEYELLTTAFRRGEQTPLTPVFEVAGDLGSESGPTVWGSTLWLEELLRKPTITNKDRQAEPKLYWVNKLAGQWAAQADVDPGDAYHLATLFERRLRDSGEFRYSLQGWGSAALPEVVDPSDPGAPPPKDPVERFLVQRRQGHCEYFATALAMMLRHVGVPCRVVVGYKTGDWNDMGAYFTVRQLHAHTWVEAFLRPDQVPEFAKTDEERTHPVQETRWRYGAWLRLDPTPASEEQSSLIRSITTSKYLDWLDYLWNNYVMEMDRPRQRQAIYRPVVGAVRQAAEALTDADWWSALWASLRRQYALGNWTVIAILLLIVAVAGAGIAYSVYCAQRALRRRWQRRAGRRQHGSLHRRPGTVGFYRRLEAALGRSGIHRGASQTQREYAETARRRFSASEQSADLAPLPALVVEAYYRVRFGGQPLDKAQADAVEHALSQLERDRGALSH
jgi:hypothetical protein